MKQTRVVFFLQIKWRHLLSQNQTKIFYRADYRYTLYFWLKSCFFVRCPFSSLYSLLFLWWTCLIDERTIYSNPSENYKLSRIKYMTVYKAINCSQYSNPLWNEKEGLSWYSVFFYSNKIGAQQSQKVSRQKNYPLV